MAKKIVFTFHIYTDGKCNNPVADIPQITSRYFERDLYEYVQADDYTGSIRRVFDLDDNGINEFKALCGQLKDNLTRSRYETTVDFFKQIIRSAHDLIELNKEQFDYLDSNVTAEYNMQIIETSAKKIKKIIYED